MKKMKRFAYVGAIALLSVLGFSACSSNDDALVDNNPNYNPETGEVNVDFVFNVSTSNEPTMRMTAANTQATISERFRGIANAYLGTFKLDSDGKWFTGGRVADKLHSLGVVINAGGLEPGTETENLPDNVYQSRRLLQLSLASGTNTLMFWGKAIKNGTDLAQGKVTMNIAEDPSQTTISMNKIIPDEDQPMMTQYQKLMAAVITYIVNSSINTNVEFGGVSKPVTLAWKDYVDVTGEENSYVLHKPTNDPSDQTKELSLLGERLAYTFQTLNTIHRSADRNELRAGYGLAISYMITDLMGNINQVISTTPLNMEEAVAQAVAAEIEARVNKFFELQEGLYKWKGTSDIKSNATFVNTEDKSLIQDAIDLNNFPADFNLPLGSVILNLDIEKVNNSYTYTYNYQSTVDTYAMGGGTTASTAFDPRNYMYPAELCYFGNSPIRVTDDTKVGRDYPDGVANWDDNNKWSTDWKGDSHVTSSTRSVAMQHNINYGTALLKSQVRYGAKVLQDNNKKLQKEWNNATEENKTIDVSDRTGHFEMTGILVGGQNPDVGWNYIAKGTSTGFGAMVYDKVDPVIQVPKVDPDGTTGEASPAVYTLLWDNWDVALKGQKQRDVFVAVEFINRSKDFYGENNLIRNGATFYIVGKLDPDALPSTLSGVTQQQYVADRSLGITWPEKYALPPYGTDGNTIKERRVFMQDYMTSATFVINETSLQHALVSVPDLRSGQISLGLSVDLQWRTGLTFNNVILGQ